MKKVFFFIGLSLVSSLAFADEFCIEKWQYCVKIPTELQKMPIFKIDNDQIMIASQLQPQPDMIAIKVRVEKLPDTETAKTILDDAVYFQQGMSDIIEEKRTESSYKTKGQFIKEMYYQRFIQIKDKKIVEFYSIYPVTKANDLEPLINQMRDSIKLK